MAEVTIPPITRAEWRKMLSGEINHNFRNYVLQLQIHEAQKNIKNNKVSFEDALKDLYLLCEKYSLAVQNDFKQIFIKW